MKKAAVLLLGGILAAGLMTGCGKSAENGKKAETEGRTTGAVTEEAGGEEAANLNMEGFPIVNEKITMTVYGCRDQNHAPWNEVDRKSVV